MEDQKEKNAWMSVPQFGDWDQKHQMPDYSMDFSKIREMRKQNKRDISRASLGNEEELISQNNHQNHHQDPIQSSLPHHTNHQNHQQDPIQSSLPHHTNHRNHQQDPIQSSLPHHTNHQNHQRDPIQSNLPHHTHHSPTTRKKFLSYFICCVKA